MHVAQIKQRLYVVLPGAKSETVPVPELVCIMALAIMFT
jgi:hypothetical protein